MSVKIVLDPTNYDDDALHSQINNWLHFRARNAWTVQATEIELESDDPDETDGTIRTLLTFTFTDSVDENDLCHRLSPRAERG